MPDEIKHGGIECTEFEALLSDALEGQLTPARKQGFDAHRRICAVCGPLFADVQAGQQWLRSLEEVEPPVHLVHNILAATSGVFSTRSEAVTAGGRATPFRGAAAGAVGFLLSFFLQTGGSVCAAATVCDVVWDDLLLLLAGYERSRGEAGGRGES